MNVVFSVINKNIKRTQKITKNFTTKKYLVRFFYQTIVLIRNVWERGGTGKLRSYWEKDIYEVVSNDPDLPI